MMKLYSNFRCVHVAHKFYESHDVWFLGPFRKLDSQMIADEITAMYKQMQQLAIVFADVSAAKRVTKTVR
ncbi:hypothetical protein DAPPUDRAFT_321531 [Daphnia pulex]|uniref:Uncharacterized protein n=1 Tax=Daphnia pulex TaxID=6669 RepID=E9GSY1_DAPPU|nr:hypothetical protein DAPPUDRAFT_321531 [Daphnia pulex]|eukprot:EFX77268.1 hypothetical protein DAPPUDRAFT_321531 [Daphnia pulex]